MEMEKTYASRGVANTSLGLSIGALGALLLNGGLNGIVGMGTPNNEVAQLKAEAYTNERVNSVDKAMCESNANQALVNANVLSSINLLQNQVNQLLSMTTLKINASAICPPVTTSV